MAIFNPKDSGGRADGQISLPLCPSSSDSFTTRRFLTELQAALKPFIELADLTSGDEQALIPYSDSGYGYTASIKASDFDRLREISERIRELCP